MIELSNAYVPRLRGSASGFAAMRSMLVWIGWISALTVAGTNAAYAANAGMALTSRISALEYRWLEARDRKTLDTILADDFVHPVAPGLFLDKKQQIAWTLAHPRAPNRRPLILDLHVRVYGDVSIANGRVALRDNADRILRVTLFTDVFVKRNGRWQAINAQENVVHPSHGPGN